VGLPRITPRSPRKNAEQEKEACRCLESRQNSLHAGVDEV
jgi:hypothetical protein